MKLDFHRVEIKVRRNIVPTVTSAIYDYTLNPFIMYSDMYACTVKEEKKRIDTLRSNEVTKLLLSTHMRCFIESTAFYLYISPLTLSHVPTSECRGTFTQE